MAHSPIIVVEDDPFTHLIPIILDPKSSTDRQQAFSDFMGRTTKAILRETERWKASSRKQVLKRSSKK